MNRKIRIIIKTFGEGWRERYPGMAIDAVYNLAIKDDREPVFCKIDKQQKKKLREMTSQYEISIGEFLQEMIDVYYVKFQYQQKQIVSGMAQDYSGIKTLLY